MNTVFNPLNYPIIFERPNLLSDLSAWQEHIPFAMFLIDTLRPDVFVELGTHSGVSYCAFCQATRLLHANTRCFAVDTWGGDAHTAVNQYGDNVLETLRQHHDPLYSGFSRLMQSTFDDALLNFEGHSIDLLHIDGFHTYDAVKHDFDTWLPKMRANGVVLFHDIAVNKEGFGVKQFWNELQQKYSTFQFDHCNGLGMLVLSDTQSPIINNLTNLSNADADLVRTFFSQIGVAHLYSQQIDKYTRLSNIYASVTSRRAWKVVNSVCRIFK